MYSLSDMIKRVASVVIVIFDTENRLSPIESKLVSDVEVYVDDHQSIYTVFLLDGP